MRTKAIQNEIIRTGKVYADEANIGRQEARDSLRKAGAEQLPLRTKRIGEFIVTQYANFSGITRIPSKTEDDKSFRDREGNIVVDECKTFAGACKKATGLDELQHPEKNPKKYTLAKELNDLMTKAYGAKVSEPSLWMTCSIRELKAQIEIMKGKIQ